MKDLTDREKNIILVRLEEIKFLHNSMITYWNKISWLSGIFALGILGGLITYITKHELSMLWFLIYILLSIAVSMGIFALIMIMFGKYFGEAVDKRKELKNNLIKDIKDGNLLKND